MDKNQKENYLILLILIKRITLQRNDISISTNEIILYLNNFKFLDEKINKRKLVSFLAEKESKEIVDFLWTNAIVNPKI